MLINRLKIDDEHITIGHESTITELAQELAKKGISDAVVLDSDGLVLGCIDDYDIVSKVIAEEKDPKIIQVKDVMSSPPRIHPESEISIAFEIMQKLEINTIPVVDNKIKLVGVVTLMDILEVASFKDDSDSSIFRRIRSFFKSRGNA